MLQELLFQVLLLRLKLSTLGLRLTQASEAKLSLAVGGFLKCPEVLKADSSLPSSPITQEVDIVACLLAPAC
jgi:hypothetical protein